MEGIDLAIAIWVANIIVALIVLCWCNKKIEDINNRWKK